MTKKIAISSKQKISTNTSETSKKSKENTLKVSSKERSFLSTNTSGLGPLIGKIFFIIFLPFKILVRFLRWYMGLFRKIPFGKVVSIIVLGIVVMGSWFLYDVSRFKFMEYRVNSLAARIAEDLKPLLGEYTTYRSGGCLRRKNKHTYNETVSCSHVNDHVFEDNRNSKDISSISNLLYEAFNDQTIYTLRSKNDDQAIKSMSGGVTQSTLFEDYFSAINGSDNYSLDAAPGKQCLYRFFFVNEAFHVKSYCTFYFSSSFIVYPTLD